MRHLVFFTALFLLLSLPSQAQETVGVEAVLVEPGVYDESKVTVTGELVGDYSRRGGVTWVQLNDDDYAEEPLSPGDSDRGSNVSIGVRLPTDMFDEFIDHPPGRYARRGPIVAVTGTFYHLDPNEGGETYVAATEITLVDPGMPIALVPVGVAPWVGIGLTTLGIVLFVGARRRRAIVS